MEIRRFSATDTRTAMRRIRDEMGSDAVILATRPIDGGVELISASDYDPDLLDGFPGKQSAAEPSADSPTEAAPAAPAPADTRVQQELASAVRDLKLMLDRETRRQPSTPAGAGSPRLAALAAQLSDAGFGSQATKRILAVLPAAKDYVLGGEQLAAALTMAIGSDPLDVLDAGGVVAAVGPTGVGKTTTIAKLAVRLAMRASTDDIALVSTDSSRLGAHQQLQSVGRLLAIPVFEVDDFIELEGLWPVLNQRRWVLIDTAGSGDTAARTRNLERLVNEQGHTLKVLLTIASNAQPSFNDGVVAHHCEGLSPTIALTKLDECPALGPALSTLLKHEQPLGLVSTGPSIPDDLSLADDAMRVAAAKALKTSRRKDSSAEISEINHERS